MKPYYDNNRIKLYHGDCREVLASIEWRKEDFCFITDPPWGLDGGTGGNTQERGRADYLCTGWEDTPDYVRDVCVPVVAQLIQRCERGALMPGTRFMWDYPRPDDIGCIWSPASRGINKWGFTCFHPILYYGKDPRAGIGPLPSGTSVNYGTHGTPPKDHPCPKPLRCIKWLLEKVAGPDMDCVIDPFAGSGTTLLAARESGRFAIGIEIEERYCEVIANRLSQSIFAYSHVAAHELPRPGLGPLPESNWLWNDK